jgi:hypothetical protein
LDTYSIFFNDQRIGEATVTKQGLFYIIQCLCSITGSVPLCVTVKGEREVDLGICVPMGTQFGLKTRIPISKVGMTKLCFHARPKHTGKIREHITVSPDEPFRYLSKLKEAYLVRQGEIAFKETEKSPGPRDSDQNP